METNKLQKPLVIIEEIHKEILDVLNEQNKKLKGKKLSLQEGHTLLFEKVNAACGFDKNGFKNAIGSIEAFRFSHKLIDFFYYHVLSSNKLNTGLQESSLPDGTRFLLVIGVLNAAFQQYEAIKTFLFLNDLSKTFKKDILKRIDKSELITTRNRIGAHNANCLVNDKGDIETYFPRFLDNNINEINYFSSNEIYGKDVNLKSAIREYYKLIEDPLIIILEEIISRIHKNDDKKVVQVLKRIDAFIPSQLSLFHKMQEFKKIS